MDNLNVPENLFANVKYLVIGNLDDNFEDLLKRGGAQSRAYISDIVTHLICGRNFNEEEINLVTDLYSVIPVSEKWILDSTKLGRLAHENAYNPICNTLFVNINAAITNVNLHDKKQLTALISYFGGIVHSHFSSKTSHLICGRAVGPAYDRAVSLTKGSVTIVTPDYIMDCYKKKEILNPDRYHPRLLKIDTTKFATITIKQSHSASDLASIIGFDEPREKVITTSSSTVLNPSSTSINVLKTNMQDSQGSKIQQINLQKSSLPQQIQLTQRQQPTKLQPHQLQQLQQIKQQIQQQKTQQLQQQLKTQQIPQQPQKTQVQQQKLQVQVTQSQQIQTQSQNQNTGQQIILKPQQSGTNQTISNVQNQNQKPPTTQTMVSSSQISQNDVIKAITTSAAPNTVVVTTLPPNQLRSIQQPQTQQVVFVRPKTVSQHGITIQSQSGKPATQHIILQKYIQQQPQQQQQNVSTQLQCINNPATNQQQNVSTSQGISTSQGTTQQVPVTTQLTHSSQTSLPKQSLHINQIQQNSAILQIQRNLKSPNPQQQQQQQQQLLQQHQQQQQHHHQQQQQQQLLQQQQLQQQQLQQQQQLNQQQHLNQQQQLTQQQQLNQQQILILQQQQQNQQQQIHQQQNQNNPHRQSPQIAPSASPQLPPPSPQLPPPSPLLQPRSPLIAPPSPQIPLSPSTPQSQQQHVQQSHTPQAHQSPQHQSNIPMSPQPSAISNIPTTPQSSQIVTQLQNNLRQQQHLTQQLNNPACTPQQQQTIQNHLNNLVRNQQIFQQQYQQIQQISQQLQQQSPRTQHNQSPRLQQNQSPVIQQQSPQSTSANVPLPSQSPLQMTPSPQITPPPQSPQPNSNISGNSITVHQHLRQQLQQNRQHQQQIQLQRQNSLPGNSGPLIQQQILLNQQKVQNMQQQQLSNQSPQHSGHQQVISKQILVAKTIDPTDPVQVAQILSRASPSPGQQLLDQNMLLRQQMAQMKTHTLHQQHQQNQHQNQHQQQNLQTQQNIQQQQNQQQQQHNQQQQNSQQQKQQQQQQFQQQQQSSQHIVPQSPHQSPQHQQIVINQGGNQIITQRHVINTSTTQGQQLIQSHMLNIQQQQQQQKQQQYVQIQQQQKTIGQAHFQTPSGQQVRIIQQQVPAQNAQQAQQQIQQQIVQQQTMITDSPQQQQAQQGQQIATGSSTQQKIIQQVIQQAAQANVGSQTTKPSFQTKYIISQQQFNQLNPQQRQQILQNQGQQNIIIVNHSQPTIQNQQNSNQVAPPNVEIQQSILQQSPGNNTPQNLNDGQIVNQISSPPHQNPKLSQLLIQKTQGSQQQLQQIQQGQKSGTIFHQIATTNSDELDSNINSGSGQSQSSQTQQIHHGQQQIILRSDLPLNQQQIQQQRLQYIHQQQQLQLQLQNKQSSNRSQQVPTQQVIIQQQPGQPNIIQQVIQQGQINNLSNNSQQQINQIQSPQQGSQIQSPQQVSQIQSPQQINQMQNSQLQSQKIQIQNQIVIQNQQNQQLPQQQSQILPNTSITSIIQNDQILQQTSQSQVLGTQINTQNQAILFQQQNMQSPQQQILQQQQWNQNPNTTIVQQQQIQQQTQQSQVQQQQVPQQQTQVQSQQQQPQVQQQQINQQSQGQSNNAPVIQQQFIRTVRPGQWTSGPSGSQRQLIQLDDKSHAQFMALDPVKKAEYIAKIQMQQNKRLLLRQQVYPVRPGTPGVQGGPRPTQHIIVQSQMPSGLTQQQQMQWLQQQGARQVLVRTSSQNGAQNLNSITQQNITTASVSNTSDTGPQQIQFQTVVDANGNPVPQNAQQQILLQQRQQQLRYQQQQQQLQRGDQVNKVGSNDTQTVQLGGQSTITNSNSSVVINQVVGQPSIQTVAPNVVVGPNSEVPQNVTISGNAANIKTKTALATMLNSRRSSTAGSSGTVISQSDTVPNVIAQSSSGKPIPQANISVQTNSISNTQVVEPSAAGTLRLMTAQHNAALNQSVANTTPIRTQQELLALQQQRRAAILANNGQIISTNQVVGPATSGGQQIISQQTPQIIVQSNIPQSPQTPVPGAVIKGKPFNAGVRGPPISIQPPRPQFYGHNPNLKLPSNLYLLGCTFFIVEYDEERIESDDSDEDVGNENQNSNNRIDHIDKMVFLIKNAGGEVENVYCQRVTHVLCRTQRHGVVMQALRDSKRCVTIYWLRDVMQKKLVFPPYQALHLPAPSIFGIQKPATKHLISVSGFEGEERDRIRAMVEESGACYTKTFSKVNTILICRKPEGDKYKKAKELNIPVVNTTWLNDVCLGNLSTMSQYDNPKYQQYNLSGPLRIDYALVPQLMAAWKAPINLTQEAHERVKRHLTDPAEPQMKRQKIEDIEEIPENSMCLEYPHPDKVPRVLLTQVNNTIGITNAINLLGGTVVESPNDATHIVMTAKKNRTTKFLMGLLYVKYVCHSNWIIESVKVGKFLPEDNFKIIDSDLEKKFNFKIDNILESSVRHKLFEGKIFYITPSVYPSTKDIQYLIKSSGGQIESKRRSKVSINEINLQLPNSYVIVSCFDDMPFYYDIVQYSNPPKCQIISTEGIISSILKQKVIFQDYIIAFNNNNNDKKYNNNNINNSNNSDIINNSQKNNNNNNMDNSNKNINCNDANNIDNNSNSNNISNNDDNSNNNNSVNDNSNNNNNNNNIDTTNIASSILTTFSNTTATTTSTPVTTNVNTNNNNNKNNNNNSNNHNNSNNDSNDNNNNNNNSNINNSNNNNNDNNKSNNNNDFGNSINDNAINNSSNININIINSSNNNDSINNNNSLINSNGHTNTSKLKKDKKISPFDDKKTV